MFNQLLGSTLLDEPLRRLLLRDQNFEDVLASLQQASDRESKDRHHLLLSELVGIFNGMGLAFNHREFEFRNLPDLGLLDRLLPPSFRRDIHAQKFPILRASRWSLSPQA